MKEIIIKEENKERIEQAIKEAEGRAKERTISFLSIKNAMEELKRKYSFAYKKEMEGLEVVVDSNAQKYPNAYKYQPQTTFFRLKYSKGSWRLTNVWRGNQDKYHDTCYQVMKMPEDLKDHIIAKYMVF